LLARIKTTPTILQRVIDTNNKRRFELSADGSRIRAVQGHSTTQVSDEGMEDSWTPVDPQGLHFYHGTMRRNVPSILLNGIRPMERTHVHMAAEKNSSVGKRHNVDALIEVSGDKLAESGIPVFRAPNGVILAKTVPPSAITSVQRVRK
jgi:putative RNA 2'-phosphotransferase